MKLVKRDEVFNKYFDPIKNKHLRGIDEITEIVLHGTGGGKSAEALINWMMKGERAPNYVKGVSLFHFVIDYNGTVYQIIDPIYWVWHSSSGAHDRKTIGIEHMNPDLVKFPMQMNRVKYKEAQQVASADIIIDLLKEHPNIKTIVGHGQNARTYSAAYQNCPGAYDWEYLMGRLKEIGYVFDFKDEKIYNIDIT